MVRPTRRQRVAPAAIAEAVRLALVDLDHGALAEGWARLLDVIARLSELDDAIEEETTSQ